MCARTSLTVSPADLRDAFGLAEIPVFAPRYNIAPTDPISAIRHAGVLEDFRWGLIPFFAPEGPKVGGKWINARSETITSMPVFRHAFADKRCLVVVDGFYEWKTDGKKKRPFHFRRKDRKPFALAGLWDEWHDEKIRIPSCTIITCAARGPILALHDRMPVLLEKKDWETWLTGNKEDARALLVPREPDLEGVEVSATVNNVRNKGPECQEPPMQGSLV